MTDEDLAAIQALGMDSQKADLVAAKIVLLKELDRLKQHIATMPQARTVVTRDENWHALQVAADKLEYAAQGVNRYYWAGNEGRRLNRCVTELEAARAAYDALRWPSKGGEDA